MYLTRRVFQVKTPLESVTAKTVDVLKEVSGLAVAKSTSNYESLQSAKRKIPSLPISRQRLIHFIRRRHIQPLSYEHKVNFEKLLKALDQQLTFASRTELRELKFRYDPFDPDRRDKMIRHASVDGNYTLKYSGDSQLEVSKFLCLFDTFVKRANFYRLSDTEIKYQILSKTITQDGINIVVDKDEYATLQIWVSGVKPEQPPPPITSIWEFFREFYLFIEYYTYGTIFRMIYNLPNATPGLKQLKLRKKIQSGKFEHRSDELYNLVVVAIQEKGTRDLILKAFRDIPTNQVNRLIPNATVKMNGYDLAACMGTAAMATYQLIDKDHNWGILLFLVTYRLYYRYRYAANIHAKNLGQILFYKNLANNKPLIGALCDRAIDEQFKAQILTYSTILHLQSTSYQHAHGLSVIEVSEYFRAQKEQFLRMNEFSANKKSLMEEYFLMYDTQKAVKHAARNLERLGLIVPNTDVHGESDGVQEVERYFRAVPVKNAIDRLEEVDSIFDEKNKAEDRFDYLSLYRSDGLDENDEGNIIEKRYVKEELPTFWRILNKLSFHFFVNRRNK